MADLNALIAQGAQFRQPESPLNMMAQMQQLQQGQSANQLNQMNIAEKQRGMEEANALRGLYSRSAGQMESPEFLQQLAAQSPTAYQAHLKFLQEQRKGKVDIGLTEAKTGEAVAKTGETKLDIKNKQRDFINRSLSEMSRNPSDANIIAFGEDAVLDGHLTPEQAKAKTQQLLAMSTPERQQYLSTQGLSNKDTAELFQSKPVEKTDGQTKWMQESNPRLPTFGQRMTGAASIQMQATPGEQLIAGTAAAGQRVTARGQDITAATAAAGQRVAMRGQDITAAKVADLKQVPVHAQKAIVGASTAISKIDNAIAALEGDTKEATGMKGYLPDMALNRMYPEGTEARAAVADIGSLVMHERSGAAVTASESPRLKPFIPLITDDKTTALKKLRRMRQIQADDAEALAGTYTPEQGFREFKTPSGKAAAAPAAGGATGGWGKAEAESK